MSPKRTSQERRWKEGVNDHEDNSKARFSCTSTSSCLRFCSRSCARERETIRIFDRHSCTHGHFDTLTCAVELTGVDCVGDTGTECEMSVLSLSRPRMGARDRNERNISLNMISGVARRDEMLSGVGEGVVATVCSISPIWRNNSLNQWWNADMKTHLYFTWQVTAVHGRDPMKAPSMQSGRDTPQTPQAMLIPDHGTTPMRRRTESRTQAEDRGLAELSRSRSESPSRALRVISNARGKKWVKKGARGVANKVAQVEPTIVRAVRRIVAYAGEKRAPETTFYGKSLKITKESPRWYWPILRCLG